MISVTTPEKIFEVVKSKRTQLWPGIIIHHTATHTGERSVQAEFVDNYHRTKPNPFKNGMGYHFLIEPDGTLKYGDRWVNHLDGAHMPGWNRFLGVAFAGHFGPVLKNADYDAEMPTEKQLSTWYKLREMFYYRIPVYPHLAFKATKCPGNNINLAYWFKVIAKPRR